MPSSSVKWTAAAILWAALASAACSETSIVRTGSAEQRVVARTYGDSKDQVRAKILDAFPIWA